MKTIIPAHVIKFSGLLIFFSVVQAEYLVCQQVEQDSVVKMNILDTAAAQTQKTARDTILYFGDNEYTIGKFEYFGYLFSDFVGFDDDRPNGLIQANGFLSYQRPILVKRVKKADDGNDTIKLDDKMFRVTFIRNVVVTDITLSKVGNQIRYLPVRYTADSTGKFFNRFDLLQYANFIAVSKVNLITIKCLKSITIYADFIPMYYNTPINDSLGHFKSNVSTIAFGLNLKMKAEGTGGYSAEVAYSVFGPSISSNIYKDKAPIQIRESRDIIMDSENFNQGHPQTIQALDLRIGYETKNKKIDAFFRFSCYQNVFRNIHTAKNIFVQVQLGISLNIQKFLEK